MARDWKRVLFRGRNEFEGAYLLMNELVDLIFILAHILQLKTLLQDPLERMTFLGQTVGAFSLSRADPVVENAAPQITWKGRRLFG